MYKWLKGRGIRGIVGGIGIRDKKGNKDKLIPGI